MTLVDPLKPPEVVRSRVVMGSRNTQTLLGRTSQRVLLGGLLVVVRLHGMVILGKVLLQMANAAGVARTVAATVQRFGGRCRRVEHTVGSVEPLLGVVRVGTVVEVGFVQPRADHGRLRLDR